MNTVYIGNTLINDIFLANDRIFDIGTPKPPLSIQYLVVAGGGGGGGVAGSSTPYGGGGGAGGLLSGSAILQPTNTNYTVVVGGGGPASAIAGPQGRNGSQSYLTGSSLSIFTIGGGGGGGYNNPVGANGGSGGGAAACSTNPCTVAGGTGTAGPPRQGYNGGNGFYQGEQCGGGAGGAAGPLTTNTGSGVYWIDGNYYAPGGKTSDAYEYEKGSGGPGRPSNGPSLPSSAGQPGVVIIAYSGTGSLATGGTISYSNGYTYHTFSSVATSSFVY